MSFFAMSANPGSHAVLPVSIAATITGDSDSTGSSTSRTHTALDVGTSYDNKKIIGVITLNDNTAARALSTFQLGGVNLTSAVSINNNDGVEYLSAILFTGDISSLSGSQSWTVTADGNVNSSCISAAVVHDCDSLTALDTATATDGPGGLTDELSLTLTGGDADGFAIAGGGNVLRTATATFATLTERADADTGGGSSDHRHATGWDLGAGGSETITWSSTGEAQAGVGALFR